MDRADDHTRRAVEAIKAASSEASFSGRREHVELALGAISDAHGAGEDRCGIAAAIDAMRLPALALAKVTADIAFDEQRPHHERWPLYVEWRRAFAVAFLGLSPPWTRTGTLARRIGLMEAMLPWSCRIATAGMRPRS